MAFDESMRFGAAALLIKLYGGETLTELAVDQSEDGCEFKYASNSKEVKSAQHTGVYKRLLSGESASITIGILEHSMDAIAHAFAHPTTDVVDDSQSTPKKKSLEFGGPRDLTEYTVQVKSPQPGSASLFDKITLYRCTAKADFSQAYKVGEERVIPVTFEALADIAGIEGTAGTLGEIISEYA
jgi:hypothetical protein